MQGRYANFPVLGDAEQVLACSYSDNKVHVTSGSIDHPETQRKIVNIMEGGEEAFRQRHRRYELWNPRRELLEIVARGEDSKHQLKANVTNGLSLAQEIVAFSNLGGDTLFIGVNDDGTFSGLERKDMERLNNLVSNAASQQVSPPSIRKPKLFPHRTGWLCGLSYPMASVNLTWTKTALEEHRKARERKRRASATPPA